MAVWPQIIAIYAAMLSNKKYWCVSYAHLAYIVWALCMKKYIKNWPSTDWNWILQLQLEFETGIWIGHKNLWLMHITDQYPLPPPKVVLWWPQRANKMSYMIYYLSVKLYQSTDDVNSEVKEIWWGDVFVAWYYMQANIGSFHCEIGRAQCLISS